MKEIHIIRCILCGNQTKRRHHVLCDKCFPDNIKYAREQWFIELLHMQRIQDYIDSVELYNIDAGNGQTARKQSSRGRLKIDPTKILLAKQMKDSGMSLRAIGKILDVSYVTVRNMLLK